jgi:hypothetical protein
MSSDDERTKPIVRRQTIAAAPAAVWAVIASPGNLEQCHPFCAANPVHTWPGPQSHDTIEYYNGRVVERRFRAWHDGEGYDLDALDTSGPSSAVSWRIRDHEAGAELTITLRPHILDRGPAAVRWAAQRAVVAPLMGRYLRSVLRGVEWRVVTGGPVTRNQFGPHRWFSPA